MHHACDEFFCRVSAFHVFGYTPGHLLKELLLAEMSQSAPVKSVIEVWWVCASSEFVAASSKITFCHNAVGVWASSEFCAISYKALLCHNALLKCML